MSQLPKCSSLGISDYSVVTDLVQPFNQGLIPSAPCLKIKTIDYSYRLVFCLLIVAYEASLLSRIVQVLIPVFLDVESRCFIYIFHVHIVHTQRQLAGATRASHTTLKKNVNGNSRRKDNDISPAKNNCKHNTHLFNIINVVEYLYHSWYMLVSFQILIQRNINSLSTFRQSPVSIH